MSKPKTPRRLMLDIRRWRNETSTLTAAERGRGLEALCQQIEALIRESNPCRPPVCDSCRGERRGVYHLPPPDRTKLHRYLARGGAQQ